MEDFKNIDERAQLLKSEGLGPFITKQLFGLKNGKTIVWESRNHRKGITANNLNDLDSFAKAFWKGLSKPGQLNWWIAIVFSIGASLFMMGCILALFPGMAAYFELDDK